MKKKPHIGIDRAKGSMSCFIGSVSVTRNGKTTVKKQVLIEQELVDGVWVDRATGKPGKSLPEVFRELLKD